MTSKIRLFQVDAFTDKVFHGNPAAVCIVEDQIEDEVMLRIAAENFLPETAFVKFRHDGDFDLRWFTPDIEMDLCGHATLATAHVIFNHLSHSGDSIRFHSKSGVLKVNKAGELLSLDFPSRLPIPAGLPEVIRNAFPVQPIEVFKSRDYVLVYENESQVREMKPNRSVLDQINLDPGGIIITAKGDTVDFVSRFFTPQATIFEDPVTGSAHCSLIPLWRSKLNKTEMIAWQVSTREGTLFCTDKGERVLIAGHAKTYLEGFINY